MSINRADLAAFLRAGRDRIGPDDVGLHGGSRRRTPGLRRQEVAELAGISIDYYIRLEQGRGPHPSRQVLAALARALLLGRDERDYLYRLAGESPPSTAGPSRELPIGIRRLLDTLVDTPAYAVDAAYNIVAWNSLARHFVGDLTRADRRDRNMIRWTFTGLDNDLYWSEEQNIGFAQSLVADLRVAFGRYPDNPEIRELVAELQATSPRFAGMWAQHRVAARHAVTKRFVHPEVGPLEFECRVLYVADTDQRIIVYIAEPDSPTVEAFRQLGTLTPPTLTHS